MSNSAGQTPKNSVGQNDLHNNGANFVRDTSSPQRDELRDKITQLRRERDAHQMDESDYVDSVLALIEQREQALLERVNEQVIGENEFEPFVGSDGTPDDFGNPHAMERNLLRAEQRQWLALLNKELGE